MVERLAVPKHGRDGGECGGGGAAVDGGEEMAAVAEQDADGVEEGGDVLGHGHGFAGVILWRIGRRGWTGYVAFHVSINNLRLGKEQGVFSARAGWGLLDGRCAHWGQHVATDCGCCGFLTQSRGISTTYTGRRKYRLSTPVLAGVDPAIGYPQPIANDAIPISNHPMRMTGSSPVMTGLDHCVRYVNSKGGCY